MTRAGHTEGTGEGHGSRHNAISQADAHSAAGIRYHLRSRSTLSCLVNHLRRSLRKQAVPRAGIEYNNAPVYSAATVAYGGQTIAESFLFDGLLLPEALLGESIISNAYVSIRML